MFPKFFIEFNKYLEKMDLSTYSIFIAIGIVVMLQYVIYILEKKHGYSRKKTNKILIILIISLGISYLFAAFFDAFYHYLDNGVFSGGVTYISGFIGGIISLTVLLYIFMKEDRKNILKILNIIIPGVVLAHAIGRIGCFSVGSCYGKPTSSIFGVLFPEGTNPYIDGIREPIHPTQLYESLFLFILFFGLTYIPKVKNHKLSAYLISYGIFRFLLEKFLRGDNRGVLFGSPPSQILSILLLISGVILLIYTRKINKNSLNYS